MRPDEIREIAHDRCTQEQPARLILIEGANPPSREGPVLRVESRYVTIAADGGRVTYSFEDIRRIE